MKPVLRTTVGVLFVLLMAAAMSTEAAEERFPLPPKEWGPPVEDEQWFSSVLFDRLEYQKGEHDDRRAWDVQAWVGGDYHKFWFKTEGETEVGRETDEFEVQALYARLISPYWYLQAGVRHDTRPEPSRSYAAIGLRGLGQHWFEIEATAFVSEDGDVSARLEAEYDLPFTQRLVLQPQFETEIAGYRDPARGIGRGLNDVTLALRLRYEIKREVAPYVGITWSRALGDAADYIRANGGDVDEAAWVMGLRLWF